MSQRQPPKVDGGKISRRDFLKLLAAAGTVMTFTPFVEWGKFLPNPRESAEERAMKDNLNRDQIKKIVEGIKRGEVS